MVLARVLNVVLGLWLVLSAFVWYHAPPSRLATVILGALCALFALLSFVRPAVRYLNIALSIVLFFLSFSLAGPENATVWNNFFVACMVFILSLAPPGRSLWPRLPEPVGGPR